MRLFITIILIFLASARITIPVSQIILSQPGPNQLQNPAFIKEIDGTAQALLRPNNFKEKEYNPFNLTIKNSKDVKHRDLMWC